MRITRYAASLRGRRPRARRLLPARPATRPPTPPRTPPRSTTDVEFDAGTTMAELNEAGAVTIGTKFDQPGFGC